MSDARRTSSAPHRNVVLVCGGRDYLDTDHVYSVLDGIHAHNPITYVIQGGAMGADTLARWWARAREVPCVTVEAEWSKHGRAAGPIRNQKMLDEYEPTYVIAFPGSRGTKDMITRARACGYRVEQHQRREEQRT